jgi:hypothetical protein
MLRKGFNGGYRFRRLQVSYGERHDEKPDKNEYSHPHDALNHAVGKLAQQFTRPPKKHDRAAWRRNPRAVAKAS